MESLELLKKKVQTAEDLLSVVKTMKSLAAVSIRQYERAVESLEKYRDVVEKGWHVLLNQSGPLQRKSKAAETVCLVMGSDQGMCGQFNEVILDRGLEETGALRKQGLNITFWSMGEKIGSALADSDYPTGESFSVPGSVPMINSQVQDVIQRMETWRFSKMIEHFYLCHNILSEGGGYEQTFYRILPLDKEWMDRVKGQEWPGRSLPMMGLTRDLMFSNLFHHYLFVSLFRAFAQSLASENTARLMAMQSAEKNILERKEALQALFREQRQASITSELFDIISGFEALSDDVSPV